MKTIHIRESYKRAWALFKTHKKILLSAALISVALSMSVDERMWQVLSNVERMFFAVTALVLVVMGIIVKIGFAKISLKIERGEEVSLQELFIHASLFWKYLGASILLGLLVGAGFLLLVIPGIYWMLTYLFVPLLVIDRHMGIRESFTESARMTKGVKWKLLGFFLVTLVVNIVGVILLGVGTLVSIPVSLLALANVYTTLSVAEASPATPVAL
jgi:uncharacterized membrane protein